MTDANKPVIGINQLLTLALNGLDSYFFKAHKDKARKLYKELADGKVVDIASLTFKQNERDPVKIRLSLDHKEFKGHITFHLFKAALQQMLINIADRLKKKEELNIFTSEDGREVLVHLPGVIQDKDNINVLVLGIAPSPQAAHLKLQFLDSDQFKKQPQNDAAAEDGGSDTPAES